MVPMYKDIEPAAQELGGGEVESGDSAVVGVGDAVLVAFPGREGGAGLVRRRWHSEYPVA